MFFFLLQGKERQQEEGEVMSSPFSLQLFSRCINMKKQDADLRIDEEHKDTWRWMRFDLIDDRCCRNDRLTLG